MSQHISGLASWVPKNSLAFSPSRLFSLLLTRQSWDAIYSADLDHHNTNREHTGTTWFSGSRAEEKITKFLETEALFLGIDCVSTTFLDLGTGNGTLLFALRKSGWRGPMVGVDYSPEAIELAGRLEMARRSDQGGDNEWQKVEFEIWDIMKDPVPQSGKEWVPMDGFDVVLDKGTFDAISLCDEVDEQQKRMCEGYATRVEKMVKVGGIFLITSCNWTEEELRRWFRNAESLKACGRIKYPTFRFGGKTGQSISSVCFRKVR